MTHSRAALAILALPAFLCGCVVDAPAGTLTPYQPTVDSGSPTLSCDDVSLTLDPSLASSYTCEIVPEATIMFFSHPDYVHIELEGFAHPDGHWVPEVSIFPVEEFIAKEFFVSGEVDLLEANLEAYTNGDGPVTHEWGALPFLFALEQGQFYYAQYEVFSFESGAGIRYLTGFTQDMGVFSNPETYTYQALTEDGRYWVSASFPVSHPVIPEYSWPPTGMTEDEFYENYDAYVSDIVDQLNAQNSGSFTPTLDALDALVSSIVIAP